jgi:hypothetical protein
MTGGVEPLALVIETTFCMVTLAAKVDFSG